MATQKAKTPVKKDTKDNKKSNIAPSSKSNSNLKNTPVKPKENVNTSKSNQVSKITSAAKSEIDKKKIVNIKATPKMEVKKIVKDSSKAPKVESKVDNAAKLQAVKKELEEADKKSKPKKQEKVLAPKPQKNTDIEEVPEFANLGAVVRYTDKELEEFRVIINDSKKEALEELNMLKERLDDLTNFDYAEESMIYSMHMAEQGSEAMEKEKTYAQIQRINDLLKKLDEALQRINDKTYGICRVCNILIAKERLEAVPITTLSASYKIHSRCPEDGIDKIEKIKNL